MDKKNQKNKAPGSKDEGKYFELEGAVDGQVVVRFPPEASGYLHIGHAKAALLNAHYQRAHRGKLVFRFDDTNPEKEKESFEKIIEGDVELLQIQPDIRSYTSDYFQLMLAKAEEMIRSNKAYVDDTPPELMKAEREQRVESKNRSNSAEKNLQMWREMLAGSERGQQYCLRAKIDIKSDNGALRDPTIYRCKPQPHPRTGLKFKVYPTYDFACPIVDSIEGVTHALRTSEYMDRDVQYYWFCDALAMRKPMIAAYSRLNLMNTVLSKRKLTYFVQEGIVDGWDDPRMPTVRGILRRGLTVQGLQQFIASQGSSKAVVVMEWDKIWAFNRKVIDPSAARYSGVEKRNAVSVLIEDPVAPDQTIPVALHPKNPELGNRNLKVGSELIIDQTDAQLIQPNSVATFISWGNISVQSVQRSGELVTSVQARLDLANKDFKKTLKVTWLAKSATIPALFIYYDHIIRKPVLGKDDDFKQFINADSKFVLEAFVDEATRSLKRGDIIQIQRKGFFICDEPYDESTVPFTGKPKPIHLISIPDGTTDLNIFPKVVQDWKKSSLYVESAAHKASTSLSPAKLDADIRSQGDLVRKLKSEKASKEAIKAEVDKLLALKAEFKKATNQDWTPDFKPQTSQTCAPSGQSVNSECQLDSDIRSQGDLVRKLKADKASKEVIKAEVDKLLALKANFKKNFNRDWTPDFKPQQCEPSLPQGGDSSECKLDADIRSQGDLVRKLKSEKASKEVIKAEVDKLLALKANFKNNFNRDWTPDLKPQGASRVQSCPKVPDSKTPSQAETVGERKARNTAPAQVKSECDRMLAYKAVFKPVSDSDWREECKPDELRCGGDVGCAAKASPKGDHSNDLDGRIRAQGDLVRKLKADKAEKGAINDAVQVLLALKCQYKEASGEEWKPDSAPAKPRAKKEKTPPKPKSTRPVAEDKADSKVKKQTRLGIEVKKSDRYSDWYKEVIVKAEMIEYYDVSGCYILRPWAYFVWEMIQKFFDAKIKEMGVQNCYFPMFISKAALETEKTHITDFAPEVAWVTRSGESDFAEPIAIRPTSETVMYPSYAKWIQSCRDLPIRLNQWCNVVRWEFKQPTPFLRSREFLWQEGHSAFASQQEALDEVFAILDLYAQIYENLLAIPVVRGKKTEKEKFAGGDMTTTCEAYVDVNGRGIQGATSHFLGQNFSKMFELTFEDPDNAGQKLFAYQNSWGISTRTIGAMIMIHGDDKGLVLPPRVAALQAVVVPCGITVNTSEADRASLVSACGRLATRLQVEGQVRTRFDSSQHHSPGWKFNHWELKGVPLRIELGPKDLAKGQFVVVRRDTGGKQSHPLDRAVEVVTSLLDAVHDSLFERARRVRDEHLVVTESWPTLLAQLDLKFIIMAPFCGEPVCEDQIKKDSTKEDSSDGADGPLMGAKSLCIPLQQPKPLAPDAPCVHPACKRKARFYTLFGRSY